MKHSQVSDGGAPVSFGIVCDKPVRHDDPDEDDDAGWDGKACDERPGQPGFLENFKEGC